ncbi:Protein FAR1-RELATED SEQUENCE 1 [Bienertia sinuspersici]
MLQMSDCYEISGDKVEDTGGTGPMVMVHFWHGGNIEMGVGAKSGGLRLLFNEASFKELEGYVYGEGHSYDDDDSAEDESYKMNPKEMEEAHVEDEWDINKGKGKKVKRNANIGRQQNETVEEDDVNDDVDGNEADSIGKRRADVGSKWCQSESASIGGGTEVEAQETHEEEGRGEAIDSTHTERDSENEDPCYEDDDEDTATEIHKRRKTEVYPTFNEKTYMFKVELVVGQRWEITSGPDLDDSKGWQIKSMQPLHERCTRTFKNRLITEHWLVNEFLDKILRNPLMKAIEMKEDMKGLVNAIHSIWPNIEHRQCARHIYSNWRKKHKGRELEKRFWRCVKATSSARYKPIVTMLEDIRLALMERMRLEKRQVSSFVANIAPRNSQKLEESYEEKSRCECKWNGEDSETGFEVIHNGVGHAIDLGKRTCSCRSWDLTGIPCAHAMSAKLYMDHQPEQYLAKWYTAETYEKTYKNLLQPVPGKTFWNHEGEGLRPSSIVTAKTWARGRKKGSKNRVGRPLPDLVQAEVPTPSTYQQQSRKGQGTAAQLLAEVLHQAQQDG